MSQVLPIRPGLMQGDVPAAGPVPRVLLVIEPATPPGIANAVIGLPEFDVSVQSVGIAGLAEVGTSVRRSDIVIVEVDPARADAFTAFEAFAREQGTRIPIIGAVRDLTVAATRQVLRAGAVDVLPLPFTSLDLAGVVTPARETIQAARALQPARQGRIVCFLGALGGCGTTAIASQAGIAWAASASVCLIDLDVQFGNAALYLDLRPKLSISDVIDAGDRLDAELLSLIAEKHVSGLSVISSPPDLVPLDTISVDTVDKILTLAAQSYDVVLVDLPGAWTNWSLRVIELSDLALLVTSLSVPGVHQARRQLEVISANGMTDRVRVVMNRVVHPMFGKIDLSETQTLLGRRIDFTIANDYPTVSAAVDQGKALSAIKPKSRVEKDVRAMAAALATSLAERLTA